MEVLKDYTGLRCKDCGSIHIIQEVVDFCSNCRSIEIDFYSNGTFDSEKPISPEQLALEKQVEEANKIYLDKLKAEREAGYPEIVSKVQPVLDLAKTIYANNSLSAVDLFRISCIKKELQSYIQECIDKKENLMFRDVSLNRFNQELLNFKTRYNI